tara:strand:- start:1975 stop:2934 length:960 start_codon:yes stop_codon:yes gene_type:complete
MAQFNFQNIASVAENNKRFVYPIEESVRQAIPLWMKFYCYEYSNTVVGRAGMKKSSNGDGSAILGLMSKEKAQIFLPAPVNFQTQTLHTYVPGETDAQNVVPDNYLTLQLRNAFDAFAARVGLNKMGDVFIKLQQGLGQVVRGMNVSGFASDVKFDIHDAVYVGNGPSRSYEIRMTLPCFTTADSKAAGAIVRAFEALSLPTALAFGSSTLSKSFHPPLWIFGIGPGDEYKFDPEWSGQPQVCVLKGVAHKKTAFETNSLAAVGNGTDLKPVAYSLTLSFQELEPAFRFTSPGSQTSTQITNRSGILMTTGTNVAVRKS